MTSSYKIVDGTIYKWGFSTLFLRCVAHLEMTIILREVHERYATCHEEARSIVRKFLNQGFYWPTMNQEAISLVLKCESCQKFSPRIQHPPVEFTVICAAWPLTQWGIDLVDPLPRSKQLTYIIAMIDYFSKWIETKALASIPEFQIIKFLKSRIISQVF